MSKESASDLRRRRPFAVPTDVSLQSPEFKPETPENLTQNLKWSAGSFALGVVLSALFASIWFGFTVDDALITARYAHHLASGVGYRFNPGGPSTDGVTPLGYAHVLALLGGDDAWGMYRSSKWLGLGSYGLSMGWFLSAVARRGGSRLRFVGPALVVISPQVGAWVGSGMETGLITALLSAAVALSWEGRHPLLARTLSGIAAALRPELLPFVLVANVSTAWSSSELGRSILRFGQVATPFFVTATLRAIVFGHPAPLSALAKRPDFELGISYALASMLLVGYAFLAADPRRLSTFARWLCVALFVHAMSVAVAGGDWMPVSRLFVPIVPSLGLVSAELGARGFSLPTLARTLLGAAGYAWVAWSQGTKLRRVESDRALLIQEARDQVAPPETLAAVDIGWLGVAFPSATIVDLGGVTDPSIARLSGSHTNKSIAPTLLRDRSVELVFLEIPSGRDLATPWQESGFSKRGERRLAASVVGAYEPLHRLHGRVDYVVIKRRVIPNWEPPVSEEFEVW